MNYQTKSLRVLKKLLSERNIPGSYKLAIKSMIIKVLEYHDANAKDHRITDIINWVSTPKCY